METSGARTDTGEAIERSQGGPQEIAEGRALTKENTQQLNSARTPSRTSEPSGLERVRQAAKGDQQLKFTALLHHVNVDLLRNSYNGLKRQAGPGVDGVTRGAYRAKPSRRVWIPKADGRQRPLGIAALEDKIVQAAVVEVLNQIWEEDFEEFSFGFRPGRNQHDALDALCTGIVVRKVNYIVDLDIKSFFDLLDVWVKASRKKVAKGEVIAVRYADDAVLGFQHREEAVRFLADLRERLRQHGLELHPEKTRLIEFGRYAAERRAKRGEGKPETFNFLGFTHICGKNHQTGNFMVLRKMIGKRMAAKLKEMRQKLRIGTREVAGCGGSWILRTKAFRHEVLRMWWWQLKRRSQRTRWSWSKFMEKLGNLLPDVEARHRYPEVRFALQHPEVWAFIQGKNRVR